LSRRGIAQARFVERVRALVKKVPARKDAVAIDDAIREVIALTRAEAANNSVSVRTQFAEGLPRVQGDRVQLQQVMLNLIVNAIQAMSGILEGPRELQISIDAVPSERGVRVGVRDTGPGLSPESLSRLFEPFYTTKPRAWASACLSAARSSKLMVGGCGRPGASRGVLCFSSRSPLTEPPSMIDVALLALFRTQPPRWQMSAVEGRTDVRIASPDFRFPKRDVCRSAATSDQAIFFVRGTMLVSTVSEAGSIPSSLTKSSDRGSMARRSKSA